MISIGIDGLQELNAALGQSDKQARFALSQSLNKVAKLVIEDERKEMRDVFDRPTPWTLGSLRQYGRATRDSLETTVDYKANFGKGIQPEQYLQTEVTGGTRRLKRFELALRSVGALPDDYFAVPGEAAKIDAFGNMTAGHMVQILSYFRAFPEAGYKANMTDKGRARLARDNKRTGARGFAYFVGAPGDRGQLGIWQRTRTAFGSAVRPVVVFVKSATYEPIYDIEYVANKTIERELQPAFDDAFAQAMATAR